MGGQLSDYPRLPNRAGRCSATCTASAFGTEARKSATFSAGRTLVSKKAQGSRQGEVSKESHDDPEEESQENKQGEAQAQEQGQEQDHGSEQEEKIAPGAKTALMGRFLPPHTGIGVDCPND